VLTKPLNILMLSVHGLVRGEALELGRDADTGGQVKYVVELARALGEQPQVEQVNLITRLVDDPGVANSYQQPVERLSACAQIIRLPFAPRRYLRKEVLWPHLDQLVDRCLAWLRTQVRLPDVIHSHYADAGYVGEQLSLLLGIPLIHTAHSLGREKRSRLIASGRKAATIDKQFNFERRIATEESVLDHASLIVASTRQEIASQYAAYQSFDARRAIVLTPGIDLARFSPPTWGIAADVTSVQQLFNRFLQAPRKPVILALSRPDTRKNIGTLVAAYAESPRLRELANLVILAGTRDDIRDADEDAQLFFTELLLDIDRHDLYGKIAIPKQHSIDQVPDIYRYAARSRGVLVNPSLNENFGLTLIEAAATGLPVIATSQGGPQEIIANCRHGTLIDPLDKSALTAAMIESLTDREKWRRWSRNGIVNVAKHYTWVAHAQKYIRTVDKLLHKQRKQMRRPLAQWPTHVNTPAEQRTVLARAKRMLITDLDNTLVGDDASLRDLLAWLQQHSSEVAFGIATGRTLDSALKLLKDHDIPMPHVMITSVGTEIHYGMRLVGDTSWRSHIQHFWRRDDLSGALSIAPGLKLQPASHQSAYKLSYFVDDAHALAIPALQTQLQTQGLKANLVASHGQFLDVLPVRASKGRAIRYLAYKWGFQLNDFLVSGDSGNDIDMLSGDTLGVVVGGHSEELKSLAADEHVFFAEAPYARGILQGIAHYRFAS
jgi:sucrose-phosphate synthase